MRIPLYKKNNDSVKHVKHSIMLNTFSQYAEINSSHYPTFSTQTNMNDPFENVGMNYILYFLREIRLYQNYQHENHQYYTKEL